MVKADWWFTTPTVLLQPLSGLWLMQLSGIGLQTGWLQLALAAYALAALCWLPVVWIQIRLRDLSRRGALDGEARGLFRIWFVLGCIAFPLMFGIYWLMLAKPF